MSRSEKKWWARFAPSHLNNPVSLIVDLLKDPNPAARSAVFMAGFGLLATPFDAIASSFERRKIQSSGDPDKPIIIVCGPPRSGTTLVMEYLLCALDVGYFTNITSIFPKSPILSMRALGHGTSAPEAHFRAFYGKSRGLRGANDALYVWDRWLGRDRHATPTTIDSSLQVDMRRFFAALQEEQGRPTLSKVNRLCTCTDLVAEALPAAVFVYLKRDPVMLAQSLYIARRDIVRDLTEPYGVRHPDRVTDDPVEDVCRQVEYYSTQSEVQLSRLGPERCAMLPYEEFCADPAKIVSRLQSMSAQISVRHDGPSMPEAFSVSRKQKVDQDIFDRFVERLGDLSTHAGSSGGDRQ